MAVNKVVNRSTKSGIAMRNAIGYVLRDDKVKEGYVDITGPFSYDDITPGNVCRAFMDEKNLWKKDSGRMYAHNIISFHKDEEVSPEEVLEIGKVFADRFFKGHQNLIAVHQDKGHLHCHIVTNSVSYVDGKKLHQTKRDLETQKKYTNRLCLERGLSVTEKGRHFDGSPTEKGEIRVWNQDKYRLLANEAKQSFVADCGIAVMEVVPQSCSKEDFIQGMAERGWRVSWSDKRKHVTFENAEGKRVRDTNLNKTFNLNIGKEVLMDEFARQDKIRRDRIKAVREREEELRKYYEQVEGASSGPGAIEESVRNDSEITDDNTESFLRKLDDQERASEEERDRSLVERDHRDAEQERSDLERKRESEERQRAATVRRHRGRGKSRGGDLSL